MSADILTQADVFGLEIWNVDFYKLLVRFGINFVVSIVIIRYLYYSVTKRKDYLFTYILISSTVFLLCFLLDNVKLQLGFALGLFAIFGIIRYRTQQVPIKEMTYLFMIIGLAVINALANKKISYAELLFTNMVIIGLTWGLEKIWLLKHESEKIVVYEKIELIKPGRRQELLADLEARTGIKISRIELGRINFMRDTCRISIFYFESENQHFQSEDRFEQIDDNEA